MRALPFTVLVALCLVAASFPLSGLGVASAAPNPVEGDVAVPAEVVLTVGAGRAGELVGVTVVVARSGVAAPGEQVRLQRRAGGGWVDAGAGLTDAVGRWVTTLAVSRLPDENRLRVGVAASGEPEGWTPAVVGLVRAPSRLSIAATRRVVDERTGNVRVRWVADAATAGSAVGVQGTVSLQRRVLRRGKWTAWQHFRTLRTDATGQARTKVRPRWSHRWRVVASPTSWTSGATSATARTTNVPAGKVVKMPKGAPRPRIKLGVQRRAVGKGANVEVRRISGSQWRAMKGVSWRRGCPVGRDDLRVVETNYWAFDGYRRRGKVVVPAEAVEDQGTKSVIYTGYDEKTEQFINPVEVETGVSDGVSTQILSGLSEGQKFMYAYFDTLAISSQLAQLPGPGGSFNPDMRG